MVFLIGYRQNAYNLKVETVLRMLGQYSAVVLPLDFMIGGGGLVLKSEESRIGTDTGLVVYVREADPGEFVRAWVLPN